MDQLIFASLSHTYYDIGMKLLLYISMLKVPAVTLTLIAMRVQYSGTPHTKTFNKNIVVHTTTKTNQKQCRVCVCVFFRSILDIKFVGRTSRGHKGGRSHRISHPLSFCGACLNFSREKDSAIPFPRRP